MDHKDYRLAAIMYTDIVGFSRMMESDEAGTLKLMDWHNQLVKTQVDAFGGKIIKTIGDAFLVEFPTANNAVKSAIEIQRELETFNASKPKTAMVLRIGVHLGDIYFSANDALGEGINIASRLQSLCKPGRVCISGEVHTLVSKKIELPIQALGAVQLKNISRGITAYEVMTNGGAEPIEEASPDSAIVESSGSVPAQVDRGAPDIQNLRAYVFQTIKQAGRRLTVDEMRSRLAPEMRSQSSDAYLESLADGGFLVRGGSGSPMSNSQYSQQNTQSRPEQYGRSDYGERHERKAEHSQERYEQRSGRATNDIFNSIGQEIRAEVSNAIHQSMAGGALSRRGPSYEQYMEQVDTRLKREEDGFRGHLIPYAAVNAGLWVIWASTTLFGFPWPLIPMLAWGIGIASHWGTLRDRKREAAQLKNLPSLDAKQFGMVRKLFKERRGWNGHLVSNVAVAGFLFVLNMITTPGVFWSVFPIAGMAIGIFSHLPVFKRKEQDLLAQLSADGLPVEVLTTKQNLKMISSIKVDTNAGPIAQEAERVRTRIIRQAKGMKGPNPLGDDFESVLENYVVQIKELSVRDREIDGILSTLPVRDLEHELDQLQLELSRCTEERMRVEYNKSIEQITKQKKAYSEMISEQKVLKLRLNNALNSLKQLEIDLARMRSLSAGADVAATGAIRDKSNELSQYLNDLRAGYQEIDALEKNFFGSTGSGLGGDQSAMGQGPLASSTEPKPGDPA